MVTVTTTTYFANKIMIRSQVSLARAFSLMDHAHAVIPPDAGILEVRSPSQILFVPDRIIFNLNRAFVPRTPQPTRRGIYERDGGICAYCGRWLPLSEATLDHMTPLSQGGVSGWENLVTCCGKCNQRKGGRTPEQARMKLLFRPYVPKVRLRPE